MSIGVSYRDASGRERKFSFSDADSARAGLTDAGALGALGPGAARRERNRAVFQQAMSAAMADSPDHPMRPAGEDRSRPDITSVEAPGFYQAPDLGDPFKNGPVLGNIGSSTGEPDMDRVSGGTFSMRVATRTAAIPVPGVDGIIRLYTFYRVMHFGGGLATGVSEETPQLLGLFSTVNARDFFVRAYVRQVFLSEDGEEIEVTEDNPAPEDAVVVRVLTHLAFGRADSISALPARLPDEPDEIAALYRPGVTAIVPVNPVLDYIDEEKKILIS